MLRELSVDTLSANTFGDIMELATGIALKLENHRDVLWSMPQNDVVPFNWPAVHVALATY